MSKFSGIHVGGGFRERFNENLSRIPPKTTDGGIRGSLPSFLQKIIQEERTRKTWSKVLNVLFMEQDKQQG